MAEDQTYPGRVQPPARVLHGPDEVTAAVGEELGTSGWHEVTQQQIDLFAEATGDHQWIHVDPERAAAGPFGRTIAHGYLTLSHLPLLAAEIFQVEGVAMGVNYGTEKVRFPAPVPAGSRIRGHGTLLSADEVPGGLQLVVRVTVEVEGGEKPVCVAESVSRLYFG